ncbi:MAG: hypothetical protein ACQES2_04445 [Pseudomonadota bacterium]
MRLVFIALLGLTVMACAQSEEQPKPKTPAEKLRQSYQEQQQNRDKLQQKYREQMEARQPDEEDIEERMKSD